MADFVHLHLHSEYSMLDGLVKIPELVQKVKSHGQNAVALTDHGNMYGAIEFYNTCIKNGVKPIVGVELYLAKDSLHHKQSRAGEDQTHITLLAMSHQGYQNLMELVSIAHFEGFSYKPRIDEKTLFKHNDDLIMLTGCMSSLTSRLVLAEKHEQALNKLKKYKTVFGDRLYVELQIHPTIKETQKLNQGLVELARQLELPLVATNDVHYLEANEAEAQDALLAIGTRKLLSEKNRLSMIDSPSFYFKSPEEMANLFADYPEAIENTVKIAQRCNLEIPTGDLIFPNFPLPEGETDSSYLRKQARQGLIKRYGQITPEIQERMDYELKIIHDKGYDTYFLITQDFVKWAKDNGIGVGPGRGSAAGSVVSYGLDITTIDPFAHGLPFERFLNPKRPTPPDIDIDFADDRREEVIQYTARKYGQDKVGHVITFGKMEARVAIRDIGRVLGMPYEDPDKIAKLIPNDPNNKMTIAQALKNIPELQQYYQQPKFKKLLDLAQKVEGTVRHSSVHAAAVIIADKPLPKYTPVQKDTRSGDTVTQYDMYSLDCNIDDDAIGLIKFDFLGLRNLSTIQAAVRLIKQTTGKEVKLDQLKLDDKNTYQQIASGETTGIFQLESAGMRRVARNLKPNQFSDITAMLALYRPGPMDLIPRFIEGKHDPDSIVYPHPSLKPILEETYGIMVYQEQILQIANVMAGYSLGEADILRRAIGKKKKKLLDKNRQRFIKQAVEKGYEAQTAEKVWGFIEAFANYGFNKSHAASYGMISYQTAYLKAHYPVQYMAALMSVESSSSSATRDEKVATAIEASKGMGIKVLPPDINKSGDDFTIEDHPDSLNGLAIRFSLTGIKNVGTAAIENILETRQELGEFVSFTQFIHHTEGRKVNKTTIESLVKVGAMDQFGSRSSMLENLEKIRQTASAFESEIDGQDNLFADVADEATLIKDSFPQIKEYPRKELLSFEKELLGLYLTDHPLADQLTAVAKRANKQVGEIDLNIHQNQEFLLGGVISDIKHVRTRKTNKEMCFGTLEDQSGKGRFVVFPRTYDEYKDFLDRDKVVLMKVKVDQREGELNLIVQKVSIPKPSEVEYENEKDYQEIFIPRKTSKETLQELAKLLKSNPGKDKIMVIIPNGGKPKRMKLPYTVKYDQKLEKLVAQLLS
ncbi:MAG: DNA polymerase III subunit alpha [Candidatus Pacebacteria bacterium]|nr:DNA polymerase III subunit alpha [Candidatus Paceibacterota bacterium]